MRRRELLEQGSRVALGIPLLALEGRAQRKQGSTDANNSRWDALIADLSTQIPQLMRDMVVPGLSIAIIRDAEVFWRRGFGVKDSTSKTPVGDDTMFEAASMSKPVFAYAVMKLCDKGVLDLDMPLTEYTPDRLLNGDPRLALITARRVLSHTSGFQDWRSEKEPLAIHFTPGKKWLYSGEGYSYLQSVVTRLTGRVDSKSCSRYEAGYEVCASDFDAYMKTNLLLPFGMTSSGYVWNDACEKRMARPHDRQGKPQENKKSSATDVARYGSAGALLSTPTDYAKFLCEVIAPQTSDAFRLNRASLAEMLRPQVTVTTTAEYSIFWGLGWRIARTKSGDTIGHGGDNAGFHSLAEASVERRSGYVIMTNGDNGAELLQKLAPEVSRRLHALGGSRM